MEQTPILLEWDQNPEINEIDSGARSGDRFGSILDNFCAQLDSLFRLLEGRSVFFGAPKKVDASKVDAFCEKLAPKGDAFLKCVENKTLWKDVPKSGRIF